MPSVGFEPTIQALERAKTFHALDRAATVIGYTRLGEWIWQYPHACIMKRCTDRTGIMRDNDTALCKYIEYHLECNRNYNSGQR
jgi:hypothetical protein